MNALTRAESQMLDCIINLMKQNGFPPTVRELQTAMGYRSTSTVHHYMKRLAAAQAIHFEPAKPRTIVVLVRQNPD